MGAIAELDTGDGPTIERTNPVTEQLQHVNPLLAVLSRSSLRYRVGRMAAAAGWIAKAR